MRGTKALIHTIAGLALLCALATTPMPALAASQEKVLHSFTGSDGMWPYAGLIVDAKGKMYSTTIEGGAYTYGAVVELQPCAGGKWKEQVLHSFQNDGKDGYWPFATLTSYSTGSLYGTTARGGRYDHGTVFRLTPGTNGEWTEEVLYNFSGGTDGSKPYGGLTFDAAEKLYGTTYEGGNSDCGGVGCGTVFQLARGAKGRWTEKVLHRFDNNGVDGNNPYGGLIFGSDGALYGTTVYGPASGYYSYGSGVVFQLMPSAKGKWNETVLYSFCSRNCQADGENPYGGVIFDAQGNLYGTTYYGGTGNCGGFSCGTVFRLTPGAGNQWNETVIYSFCGSEGCLDGVQPYAGLIIDSAGNLYGTTTSGTTNGNYCGDGGCGIVFELVPGSNGQWTENVLYSFAGEDGAIPYAGLILDASGHLYGTTSGGGAYGNGVVFEITP